MAIKINTLPKGHVLKSPNYTYRIESVLGCGGFGITYLAYANIKVGNVSLKGWFAIKEHFVSSDCERDPDTSCVVYSNPAKERVENSKKDFIAEAKRLKKVGTNHPNIVKVNEVFEANNTAYYVMEYLEGQSLRSWVRRNGVMDEKTIFYTMNPIIEAVQYLHNNRMTHLDIKPDNIMITHDDNGNMRSVLIDFGLSKHYDKDGKPTSTINTLGCSDGYAPVEQYAGITRFSPTADIYALGATMWFCLVGKDPKKSTDLDEGELSSRVESISKEISVIIGKACALNRNRREISICYKIGESIDSTNQTISTQIIGSESSTVILDDVREDVKAYQLFTFNDTSKKILYCLAIATIIYETIGHPWIWLHDGLDSIFRRIGAVSLFFLSTYGFIETKTFVKSSIIKYVWAMAVSLAFCPGVGRDFALFTFIFFFIIFTPIVSCYELIVDKKTIITQLFFILAIFGSAYLYIN